jgi:hypothetical protein
MSRDLDQLLHDTAATPRREPDPAGFVRSGRRRRRRRHAAGAASALAAVLAVTAVGLQAWPEPAPQIVDQPEDAAPAQPTPAPAETDAPTEEEATGLPQAQPVAWPDGPSQSPEDAAAQGVPAKVAALPIADRLDLRGSVQAPEGVYVHSSLPPDTIQALGLNEPLSGGAFPTEYRELLLLDPDTLAITRAWPVAGLYFYEPPTVLDAPNVVVMAGVRDGANPWSGVVVIDRDTSERRGWAQIRDEAESWPEAQPLNNDWVTVVPAGDPFPLPTLGAVDNLLLDDAGDGVFTLHDHVTLEVVDEFRHDTAAGLVRVGDGTFVDPGAVPAPFLVLDRDGFRVRDDVAAFPGPAYASGADVHGPALVSAFRDGRSTLWRLDGQEWVEVFDGGTHPVFLHRALTVTWATGYDWQRGGVLFRGGTLVAERPIGAADQSSGGSGRGEPVVAERSDGSILWITNGVPYIVDLGGTEQLELGSELPCDAMPAWTQLPAVFYVCDGPNTFAVGVSPADRDASLQELLDQLGSVPDEAATAGMTTVFGDIAPPTISVDGTTATLDFDDTLELAFAQTYTVTYLLEQVLTTVWVNSSVDTIQLTLDGDCDAASVALETVSCHTYDRADGNNTLLEAAQDGLSAKTARLNEELHRMIRDAGYEPLGGDHDIGNATNSFEDGAGVVFLTLWDAADVEEQNLYGDVEVYEGQDGGGAMVELGTRTDGSHIAILYCDDLVLAINTGDSSEQGRQRADRIAQPFAAVMGCPTDM